MTFAIGIDTGGTYTDAVVIEYETGQVVCSAKALTTRRDLSIGISEALDAVLGQSNAPAPSEMTMVGLSTTLATNAIVEGHGSPACLILIGYDPNLIRDFGYQDKLVTKDVVYVAGGHDISGDELSPLDEEALVKAIRARQDRVEAFAVSGYFSVRNPSHELRAQELIHELTDLPVTCGHHLTTRLDSVRRATTVALNARLVPLLRELIRTMRQILAERAITAPLMVVKGDGSLMRAEWAVQRPIETILSGPAASAVGAWHLANQPDEDLSDGTLWAVDVGGTTTDIASLRDGRPSLSREGAQVGQWRTMVEAVDIHTVGLGGDSHVRVTSGPRLIIGPQRVVPLSLLAHQYPDVITDLDNQIATPPRREEAAQFLIEGQQPQRSLCKSEAAILERLASGPAPLASQGRKSRYGVLTPRQIEWLVAERLVIRSGFTPTDALHALGKLEIWNTEAARLGAQILATQHDCGVEELCRNVIDGVSKRASRALVSKSVTDEISLPDWDREPTAALLLNRALSNNGCGPTDEPGLHNELACTLVLRRPVVAIGAPVEAYMPRMAEMLHTRLIIPHHSEVANAVGAAVGSVVLRQQVLITPLKDSKRRLHLPNGVRDFDTLGEAVDFARELMVPWMEALAREVGTSQAEVQMERIDKREGGETGRGNSIYLGTELTFTVVGRPSPAQS